MEECELCGKRTDSAYVVDVEGVELRVCAKCASGKKVISRPPEPGPSRPRYITRQKSEDEQQIREDYGAAITRARERMNIPLKVLAEMLNEKETLLLRIEQGKTLPSAALTKKLEHALGIKLAESSDSGTDDQRHPGRTDSVTMADYLPKGKPGE